MNKKIKNIIKKYLEEDRKTYSPKAFFNNVWSSYNEKMLRKYDLLSDEDKDLIDRLYKLLDESNKLLSKKNLIIKDKLANIFVPITPFNLSYEDYNASKYKPDQINIEEFYKENKNDIEVFNKTFKNIQVKEVSLANTFNILVKKNDLIENVSKSEKKIMQIPGLTGARYINNKVIKRAKLDLRNKIKANKALLDIFYPKTLSANHYSKTEIDLQIRLKKINEEIEKRSIETQGEFRKLVLVNVLPQSIISIPLCYKCIKCGVIFENPLGTEVDECPICETKTIINHFRISIDIEKDVSYQDIIESIDSLGSLASMANVYSFQFLEYLKKQNILNMNKNVLRGSQFINLIKNKLYQMTDNRLAPNFKRDKFWYTLRKNKISYKDIMIATENELEEEYNKILIERIKSEGHDCPELKNPEIYFYDLEKIKNCGKKAIDIILYAIKSVENCDDKTIKMMKTAVSRFKNSIK